MMWATGKFNKDYAAPGRKLLQGPPGTPTFLSEILQALSEGGAVVDASDYQVSAG